MVKTRKKVATRKKIVFSNNEEEPDQEHTQQTVECFQLLAQIGKYAIKKDYRNAMISKLKRRRWN